MKRYLTILSLLLSLGNVFGQSAAVEQTILKTEADLLQAITNRDAAFIASAYDDSYIGVLPSGEMVDKAKIVEYFSTGSPYVVVTFEDLDVRVLTNFCNGKEINEAAIATGKMVTKSKTGTIIGQTRFIRVYQLRAGAWKIVEAQGTIIIAR